jgi:hypothetical protein
MSTTGLTITDLLFIYTGRGATKIQNGDLTLSTKRYDNLLETILAVKSYVPKHSFVRRGFTHIEEKRRL